MNDHGFHLTLTSDPLQVWRIDRLTHQKLADVGSRVILCAWFDKSGERLVMVEQRTADELRVVVCQPQTLQVAVKENTISVVPFRTTVRIAIIAY